MNSLLSVVRSSLTDLGKAVRGLALMSADLDAVGKALFDGKVPAMWLKKSFPSLKVRQRPCVHQQLLHACFVCIQDTNSQHRLACLTLLDPFTSSMQVAMSYLWCFWCCGLTCDSACTLCSDFMYVCF